jgi:uncharacterized membrane protein YvlD (DUF360 family)
MRGIALRWLTLTGAIIFASYMIEGIQVSGFMSALGAAAILGILNAFFRPVALILTLPINILARHLRRPADQPGELGAQCFHKRTGVRGYH